MVAENRWDLDVRTGIGQHAQTVGDPNPGEQCKK
jgi:hypothetical protein